MKVFKMDTIKNKNKPFHNIPLQSPRQLTPWQQSTYLDDEEGSHGVLGQYHLVLLADPNVPVRVRLGRPVLVALDTTPLLQVGQHYDSRGVLLPHHPPEVLDAIGNWSLGGNEGTGHSVTLEASQITVVVA